MTDKELLQYAAKAAGIDGYYASLDEFPNWMTVHDGEGIYYTASQAWNPLESNDDAFRLAVKLRLDVMTHGCTELNPYAIALLPPDYLEQDYVTAHEITEEDDPYAATRRAITRAAAEIGRAKAQQTKDAAWCIAHDLYGV